MKIKIKIRKKAALSIPQVIIGSILLLTFLIIILSFADQFGSSSRRATETEACRISLILNAHVRGIIDAKFWERHKERIPVNCPRRPELVIKHNDISRGVKTAEGKKMNILRLISNEMVITHYKTIGDMHDSEPFAKEPGIYCIFDRDIIFDDKIKNDDDLNIVDSLITYQINSRSPKTSYASGKYYSEYLYGYKKNETQGMVSYSQIVNEVIQNQDITRQATESIRQKLPTTLPDINFNTDKDYVVMRVIFKGMSPFDNYLVSGNHEKAALGTGVIAGGVCLYALKSAIFSNAIPIVGQAVSIISAVGVLGCAVAGGAGFYSGGQMLGDDNKAFFGHTIVIAKDDVQHLGCTRVYQ
jgi:hypothetical protein